MSTPHDGQCDAYFEEGADYVFITFTRFNGSLDALNTFLAEFQLIVALLPDQCTESMTRSLCLYYFMPCGNMTHFSVPPAICAADCLLSLQQCPEEFGGVFDYLNAINAEELGISTNCSGPRKLSVLK